MELNRAPLRERTLLSSNLKSSRDTVLVPIWDEPCVHGCGYIHLSNSTHGTRKKCCINGRLSSASDNFDVELMMGYVLDELPVFVRKVISNINKFSQKSSTYNNLDAMAATVLGSFFYSSKVSTYLFQHLHGGFL